MLLWCGGARVAVREATRARRHESGAEQVRGASGGARAREQGGMASDGGIARALR